MAKKTHNCLVHLLKHLHIKAQLLPFTQKAKCCSLRGNPHQDKLRLRATLHNIVWHGLYILYTQMQWHTIGLINPPALVHSIDYESQPLIRGGLNRAAALKEVTLGWLTPSHTLWSQGVTTGKTVCTSLRVSMHLLMAQTGPLCFAFSAGRKLFKKYLSIRSRVRAVVLDLCDHCRVCRHSGFDLSEPWLDATLQETASC